ncbi:putative GTP-binding protein yptV4 [Blattamonas nauphoetae]|uniref:GTP-binding protein yptV4 n=1 Tax=Blattamonas nauphoetae TaxID=2049346 RepID=A0ABQ9YLI1_9EUKA|nr:putative GTP-binding protein yptV4 [Blattamonas nauphoetae]
MTDPNDPIHLKFIIIGEANCGKTAIMRRFTEHKFYSRTPLTVTVDITKKPLTLQDQNVVLHIADTAGQERFRSVTKSYYRGSAAVLLVFDITDRTSFEQLGMWLTDVRNLTQTGTVCALVGNKFDLQLQREVEFTEALAFADDNGLHYFETSAKTGLNVEDVFLNMTWIILGRIKEGKLKVLSENGDVALIGEDGDDDEIDDPDKKIDPSKKTGQSNCNC